MSKVIWNKDIDGHNFLIKVDRTADVLPGQFFMLRAWDKYPTLSRPLSIYDVQEDGLVFLIEKVGVGTGILSKLCPGDEINVFGPYGNGFNYENIKEISLIGGGVGAAPFYYLSKKIKEHNKDGIIDLYLGEREGQELEKCFLDLDVNFKYKKGGLITDIISYDKKLIYTCGPDVMMYAIRDEALKRGIDIYLSLDKRMGCGVGACLSCTCDTKYGRVRSCKEGPVFKGSDLIE
ncbi:dihydroorotate dehydrogenase electron transfer subunit [Peptoniphilus sp. ING2-D1G]|nr:dihydroorotate dehydrogenase electron transfer subunit [Peptoniphilus sp. ING2-D1G]